MVDPVLFDLDPFLARFLLESHSVHVLTATPDGTILGCNAAMIAALGVGPDQVIGQPLWTFLPDADAVSLRERLARSPLHSDERFLVNFVDARHAPFTLECRSQTRPAGILLLGEPPDSRNFREEWLQLNNPDHT